MIVFKDVTPQDKEIFDSFYKYKCLQNSESSFANLCAYAFLYYGQYAIVENCLVTRIHFERNKSLCYHYPIGPNGMDKAIERIIEDAQEQAYNLHFICEHSELPSRFAQRFRSEAKRDFFDYLLNEVQVVGTPGEGFGEEGKSYFRLTSFGSREDTEEAVRRLERIL